MTPWLYVHVTPLLFLHELSRPSLISDSEFIIPKKNERAKPSLPKKTKEKKSFVGIHRFVEATNELM
jgi:hypothetical protein